MALTLRNTKGSKLTFNEMDGNFTYLEGLTEGKITIDAFNAFTGSAEITGSFTGSFVGDGSQLTGVTSAIPSGVVSSSLQFDNLDSPFTGSFTGSFVGDGSGLTGISGGSDNWFNGTTYLSSSVDIRVEGNISGSNISSSGEIYSGDKVKVGSFENIYDDSTTIGDGYLSFMRNNSPYISLTKNVAQPNSEMSNITFRGYSNFNYYNKAKISVINGDAADSVSSTLAFSTKATGFVGTFNSNDIDLEIVSGSAVNIYRDTVIAADKVLTLEPIDPLPSNPSIGSFAVSGSTPPVPYFWDGSSWNALY